MQPAQSQPQPLVINATAQSPTHGPPLVPLAPFGLALAHPFTVPMSMSVPLLPAIVSDPTDWRAQNEAGMVMHRNHLLDQAVEHLTLAVQYGPPDCVARRNLAIVKVDIGTRYKLNGQIDLAMQCYHEAIACNPHYAPAYFNCAVIHSERGQYEQALKYYQIAVQNNPNYVEALCVEESTTVWARHCDTDTEWRCCQAKDLTINHRLRDECGNEVSLSHAPLPIHLQPLYRIKHHRLVTVDDFHGVTEDRVLAEYRVSVSHLVSVVWRANTTILTHHALRKCSELSFYHIVNNDSIQHQLFVYEWTESDCDRVRKTIEASLWDRFREMTKSSIVCEQHALYDLPVQALHDQLTTDNVLFDRPLSELIGGIELNEDCADVDPDLRHIWATKCDEVTVNNHCYSVRHLSIAKEEGHGTVVGLSVACASQRFLLHNNIVTHNCFSEDTRLLTDSGFLFVHEALARLPTVRFACYNEKTAKLEYHPATAFICLPRGHHRMVEFTQKNEQPAWLPNTSEYDHARVASVQGENELNGVSLLVTEDHDMYVQISNADGQYPRSEGVTVPYSKVPASDLLPTDSCPTIRLLACAVGGVRPDSAVPLPFIEALGLRPHQVDAFIGLYGFWLGDGSMVYGGTGQRRSGPFAAVQFGQRKQGDLIWLRRKLREVGQTQLSTCHCPSNNIDYIHVTDPVWFRWFDAEYNRHHRTSLSYVEQVDEDDYSSDSDCVQPSQSDLTMSSDDSSSSDSYADDNGRPRNLAKSAKWFGSWVLISLTRDQLRLLLEGVRRADGAWATDAKRISTSSVRFRDELIVALLHAGYTARFEMHYEADGIHNYKAKDQSPDQTSYSIEYVHSLSQEEQANFVASKSTAVSWTVNYAEPDGGNSRKEVYAPVLHRATDVVRRDDYYGRVWCVKVPHGLLIAQRAVVDRKGCVTKASRPVIVGNCNIGVIYKNSAQLNTAIDYYERALKVNPNFHVASSNLSIALTDQGTAVKNEGRIDEGIQYYKRALHHNSKYAAAWYNLGVAFAEKQRFDDAKVCYEMCVLFDNKCAEAMNNLGVIYKDRGNLDQAVYYYHEALAAHPTFSQTLNNLSVIYTMLGKLDEAYEYCIAEGAEIALSDGLTRTIESFTENETVWSFDNSDGGSESGLVTGRSVTQLKRGAKRCLQLKLVDGRSLTCTPDHRILTVDSTGANRQWLQAKEIETDRQRVLLGPLLPEEAISDDESVCDWCHALATELTLTVKTPRDRAQSTAFARLYGYAVASAVSRAAGPLSCLTFAHRIDAEAAIADIQTILNDATVVSSLEHSASSSSSYPLSLSLPLSLIKLLSTESSDAFPSWLSSPRSPRAVVREFVAGVCGRLVQSPAPATLAYTPPLWTNITIPHTDEKFLRTVYDSILRLGLQAETLVLDQSCIEVTEAGFHQFLTTVGARYASAVTMRMTVAAAHVNSQRCQRRTPATFVQLSGATLLFGTISPFQPIPAFHLPVIAVSDAGERATYDLTISTHHSFLSNGVVVHNCSRAIKSNPHYAEALNNLGVLYRDEGRIEEAIASYAECLRIDPTSKNASQNRLLALNSLTRVEPLLVQTSAGSLVVNGNSPNHKLFENYNQTILATASASSLSPSSSFNNLSDVSDAARTQMLLDAVFDAHRQWGLSFANQYERERITDWPDCKPLRDRVLRVGYLSADFFTHSVSYFIEAPLVHRDKSRFHVTCYSNVARKDRKTNYFETIADVWRPIHDKTTKEVAEMIRRDRIDVLIECTGHTAGNRLDVCAVKPAPIQMTWIGYPNTTGLSTIDYRLTDDVVDPVTTTQQFTEKLIRFKGPFLCYTPPLDAPPVSDTPALKNGYITFGSFNSLAKINDRVIAVWCAILNTVPFSRMLIKCKPFASPTIQAKVQAKFAQHGINSSRIDLISLLPTTAEHLDAYSSIDISVDTFPYSGTTTTCEALHSGVPVITYHRPSPSTHSHSVGATLLSRLGEECVTRLIATTEQQYIELAVKLASDVAALQSLRQSLRERLLSSPVCDGPALTRELEARLIGAWHEYCDQL